MTRRFAFTPSLLACVLILCVPVLRAQDQAQIRIHVAPEEAYVFLDSNAIGQGEQLIKTTAGTHKLEVYAYGFQPMVKDITLEPGTNPSIQAYLEAKGEPVGGPWGEIQIEGAPHAAVLLNGKTPDFFVTHGDAANHHFIWKQQLIVPPGTHEVTVVDGGNTVWSGPVKVDASKRTIVYVNQNGRIVEKLWSRGSDTAPLPRFQAGTASTTIVVAPVTGSFTATPQKINCNDPVKLAWNTTETLHAYLTRGPHDESPLMMKRDAGEIPKDAGETEEVALSGEKTVSPLEDTHYSFKAHGPGGYFNATEHVKVNPVVEAIFTSPDEPMHYVRMNEKIVTLDKPTLKWNVINADNIQVEPFGKVAATGEQSFEPTPKTTASGVDEVQTFKLTATNVCGGKEVQTAEVHLVGHILPEVSSVFFPTALPTSAYPDHGLLISQQKQLTELAEAFKIYMQHTPDAKLVLLANADPRESKPYNKKLSQRRAEVVWTYLAALGIPKEKIELKFFGKEQPLSKETIAQLEAQNPQPAPAERASKPKATGLAYNRRVDIVVTPAAIESAKYFPHKAVDASTLWQPTPPKHKSADVPQ
jgi:hypothetical protein